MVQVEERAYCRFAENCAAWRAARDEDEPQPPLPYWKKSPMMIGGVAILIAGCIWLLVPPKLPPSKGDEIRHPPSSLPIVVEDPALLRARSEGATLDLQGIANRILRTHRALAVAEDAALGKDVQIAGMTSIASSSEKTLERTREAHGESRLFAGVSQERREEIRSDNLTYIDALVRLSSFPPSTIDPLLANLRVRVSGVEDKVAALDIIRIHLDATRSSGKLDEQRVFEDFRKTVPSKP